MESLNIYIILSWFLLGFGFIGIHILVCKNDCATGWDLVLFSCLGYFTAVVVGLIWIDKLLSKTIIK